MSDTIKIIKPDDWHCHLRDGDYLSRTVSDTAAQFGRAVVMPNLVPPITNLERVESYRQRILKKIPVGSSFQPLMTLYLTDNTSPSDLRLGKSNNLIIGCKLYPAGATTHSEAGVERLAAIYPLLEVMEEIDLPLQIHGEVTHDQVDVFHREQIFIDSELEPMVSKFPKLRVVLEHISTQYAVDFITSCRKQVAATITPHHLLLNRNHLLVGGIHPHYYCLPILKRREDQEALIKVAISGHSKFFLGTDSAPHAQNRKESNCGCAGIYSAHAAIELYCQVFDQNNALDQLENFSSINGPNFYQLPINQELITLIRQPKEVPKELNFGEEKLIPLFAGKEIDWQVQC